jgi:hypothetical protein
MIHSSCRFCGIQLDGGSGLCVRCWGLHLKPCLNCMRRNKKGKWVPKSRRVPRDDSEAADPASEEPRRRKKKLLRDTCENCSGRGWLLDEPAADPAITHN